MSGHARQVAGLAGSLLLAVGSTAAQYDYGGSGGGGGEGGFVLWIEAGLTNPRNADNVVATAVTGNLVQPIVPDWDDAASGRIGFGYRWGGGSQIALSAWGFATDVQAADTGSFAFSIGPAIDTGPDYIGDTGTAFDITTEIEARTVDLAWSHAHEPTDVLAMEWSVGLRYAGFEETSDGRYADPSFVYVAAKSHEAEMIGARIAARGTAHHGGFFLGGGLGFSMLDGEIEASSSLRPQPLSYPVSFAGRTDDGRSGTILDLEVSGGWRTEGDRLRIAIGWEESVWEGLTEDLMRNLPGAAVELGERDSVTFSSYKVGLHFRF
jgi:hypothetical protein